MKILISWSGDRSEQIAQALYSWLPIVIQSVIPWMSKQSVGSGARWRPELNKQLETTKFGILCLTPENLHSDWILFEAGALSRSLDESRLVPYLYQLSASDIQDPLAQFQSVAANRAGTKTLLDSINKHIPEPLKQSRLDILFEKFWDDLREKLDTIPHKMKTIPTSLDALDREVLEELLRVAGSRLGKKRSPAKAEKAEDITPQIESFNYVFSEIRNKILRSLSMKNQELALQFIHEMKVLIDSTPNEIIPTINILEYFNLVEKVATMQSE